MWQEFLHIPGLDLTIYSYGFMLMLGALLGMELLRRLSRKGSLPSETLVNLSLLAILAGLAGSRIVFVLQNLDSFLVPERTFWGNLGAMLNIREGGLVFFGGFLGALPVVVGGLWLRKVPLARAMDVFVPCVMVGLSFGRMGCFLNGCCYGAETNAPWSVQFPYHSVPYLDEVAEGKVHPPQRLVHPDGSLKTPAEVEADPIASQLAEKECSLRLHPTQLYASVNAMAICAVLLWHLKRSKTPGTTTALMFILYGGGRYIEEMFRVEPPDTFGMSFSMFVGVCLLTSGVVLWPFLARRKAAASPATTP